MIPKNFEIRYFKKVRTNAGKRKWNNFKSSIFWTIKIRKSALTPNPISKINKLFKHDILLTYLGNSKKKVRDSFVNTNCQ